MSIVLGYDESPGASQALIVAIEMAQRFDENLVTVYATAPPTRVGEEFHAHQEALDEIGRTVLEHAVAAARNASVEAQVELVPDKPAPALIDVAERHDARFIIVGTWGESPFRSAVVGSTPHKLLYLSDRPVICVPAPTSP